MIKINFGKVKVTVYVEINVQLFCQTYSCVILNIIPVSNELHFFGLFDFF